MARYFSYKSPEELVADAAELGSSLALTSDLSPLFGPCQIGTLDGSPGELTYRRFGADGAKLVWDEATAIDEAARMNPGQLRLRDGTATLRGEMLNGCGRASGHDEPKLI